MDNLIKAQCLSMITSLQIFMNNCQKVALADDGTIDKQEEKDLEKIRKETEKYIKKIKSFL